MTKGIDKKVAELKSEVSDLRISLSRAVEQLNKVSAYGSKKYFAEIKARRTSINDIMVVMTTKMCVLTEVTRYVKMVDPDLYLEAVHILIKALDFPDEWWKARDGLKLREWLVEINDLAGDVAIDDTLIEWNELAAGLVNFRATPAYQKIVDAERARRR